MRIKIKICGITREEDALTAVAAGADALGFMLHRPSSRYITPENAAAIVRGLPPFVTTVAVVVDPDRDWLMRVLETFPVDLLQFHGDEAAPLCESFGWPYIKTVSVHDQRPAGICSLHPGARALLLDTFTQDQRGGTGRVFDWTHFPRDVVRPLILAGGLTPDNVAAAIAATRPYAVDVSGGVEGAQRGIKDAARIRRFIDEARHAADQI